MIEIRHGDCWLTIKGHAGYAPAGQDTVCAAVTTLGYTLISSLRRVSPDGLVEKVEPGNMEIMAPVCEEARQAFRFCLDGLEPLAEQYPLFIKLIHF